MDASQALVSVSPEVLDQESKVSIVGIGLGGDAVADFVGGPDIRGTSELIEVSRSFVEFVPRLPSMLIADPNPGVLLLIRETEDEEGASISVSFDSHSPNSAGVTTTERGNRDRRTVKCRNMKSWISSVVDVERDSITVINPIEPPILDMSCPSLGPISRKRDLFTEFMFVVEAIAARTSVLKVVILSTCHDFSRRTAAVFRGEMDLESTGSVPMV
jgi:hypothetical protein